MKIKTLYTCEVCHTDYANEKDAKACEAIHGSKFEIVSKRFLPYKQDKSGFPISITIANEEGEEQIYKR